MGGQYYNPLQRMEEKGLLAHAWIYVPSYYFWLRSFVKAPLPFDNNELPLGVCRFLMVPSSTASMGEYFLENDFWHV